MLDALVPAHLWVVFENSPENSSLSESSQGNITIDPEHFFS